MDIRDEVGGDAGVRVGGDAGVNSDDEAADEECVRVDIGVWALRGFNSLIGISVIVLLSN